MKTQHGTGAFMGNHYEFNLEKVLAFRRIQKDLAVTSLAEAESVLEQLGLQMRRLRLRIVELERINARHGNGNAMDIPSLLRNHQLILCLREEERRLQLEIRRQEEEVAGRRRQVMERSRDHKVMDHLKERDHAAFVKENRRKEANDLDEMTILRSQHQARTSA